MSARLDALKRLASGEVEAHRAELSELALRLHANPELGFEEFRATAWLTEMLERNGFIVERGICELPTAFRATYARRAAGKPVVAFLAEYDALPGLGHACGHNLIAASAVGAGLAARRLVDRSGGTALVVGTPAEEVYGGKVYLVERGAFQGVDAAMLTHPGARNRVHARALACIGLQVEYFGKSAHAAARPQAGVNALEALLLAYGAINSLRQHIDDGSRIHGIITHGGDAPNVVPAYAAASFMVRTVRDDHLDALMERVLACFHAAAEASGARLQYKWDEARYRAMRSNVALADLFGANLRVLGREVDGPRRGVSLGSTDMGNVSAVTAAIHPSIAIAPEGVGGHSPEFAVAAASDDGLRGMVDAAKAMAITAADLLAQPRVMARVRAEAEGSTAASEGRR